MPKCTICNDTGVIDTGNNDLPCSCEAGNIAKFSLASVEGTVTGKEVKLYFLNNSPLKIEAGKKDVSAMSLPNRRILN